MLWTFLKLLIEGLIPDEIKCDDYRSESEQSANLLSILNRSDSHRSPLMLDLICPQVISI